MKTMMRRMLLPALVFLAACSSGPSSTVKQFWQLNAEGKNAEASKLVVANGMPEEKMIASLSPITDNFRARNGLKGLEVLDETVNGERATVRMKMNFNDGTSREESSTLVKTEEGWRLEPQ